MIMSQFHHNLIFSNGAYQFLFQSPFNLLGKRIKNIIEQNNFWLHQQRVCGAKSGLLLWMYFFIDSVNCLSNCYYRQRVTFWFLLCFYLVYSLDCLVKIWLSWRFFHKYSIFWNPFWQIEVACFLAEKWEKKGFSWLLCMDLEGLRVLFHVLVSTNFFLVLFCFLLFRRNHNRKQKSKRKRELP